MKEAIKEHTSERMIEYDIARGIGIMAVLLGQCHSVKFRLTK